MIPPGRRLFMPPPRRTTPLACATLVALLTSCGPSMAQKTASPAPGTSPPARPTGAGSPPGASAAAARPPEPGRLAGITAAHNRAREALGIAPLSWSPELARYAQRWADKLQRRGCDLQHRPRSGPDAQRHGENLFGASGQSASAEQVVDMWLAERADYDAKTNRCRGVCGHYTQVVWRKSERLGCAMAVCGDTEVWVCNYDPPGNFMGQRPY